MDFRFQFLESGFHKITLGETDLALDASGPQIALKPFNGGDEQLWLILPFMDDDHVKFVSKKSRKCLDVPGCNFTNNVSLQLYEDNDTPAQMFQIARRSY